MTNATIRPIYQNPDAKETTQVIKSNIIIPAVIPVNGLIIFAFWCANTYIAKYIMLYNKIKKIKKINLFYLRNLKL